VVCAASGAANASRTSDDAKRNLFKFGRRDGHPRRADEKESRRADEEEPCCAGEEGLRRADEEEPCGADEEPRLVNEEESRRVDEVEEGNTWASCLESASLGRMFVESEAC
jgi:hypothetical protein